MPRLLTRKTLVLLGFGFTVLRKRQQSIDFKIAKSIVKKLALYYASEGRRRLYSCGDHFPVKHSLLQARGGADACREIETSDADGLALEM